MAICPELQQVSWKAEKHSQQEAIEAQTFLPGCPQIFLPIAADEVCTLVPTQEPGETYRLSPLKIVNVCEGGERTTLSSHQRMLSEHDIQHMVGLKCAGYSTLPSPVGSRVHLTYRRQCCVRGLSDSRAPFQHAKQCR